MLCRRLYGQICRYRGNFFRSCWDFSLLARQPERLYISGSMFLRWSMCGAARFLGIFGTPPCLSPLARARCIFFAGAATAPGAGSSIGEDSGGCGPVPNLATALLLVYVQQAARGGHPVRALVLLGVHRGVVPDEPGVPAVQAARHSAVDRLPVPVRLRVKCLYRSGCITVDNSSST